MPDPAYVHAAFSSIAERYVTANHVLSLGTDILWRERVVQMVAEQTQQGGFEIFLYLMVIISINLGLMNLLPIPGLDGSRLIFMAIEAVRRKPVSQNIESMIHLAG